MNWFNPFGLVFMSIIILPNIIYAVKIKNSFENQWNNKLVELLEQIGRYGCFSTMIFNVPHTAFGFWFKEAFVLYLIVNTILIFAYCLIWIILFRNNTIFKALSLSILPSAVFLFSGIMSRSVLLIISSVIFAPCHIIISLKNAKQ